MNKATNIFNKDLPEGWPDFGAIAGSSQTIIHIADIAAGAASCPYHYEYVEEWMLVLEGAIAVRGPNGQETFERGDLVRFPPGPDGAHKIMNRSNTMARVLLWSNTQAPAVSVYPDSNKIAVWAGADTDDAIFVRDTAVSWEQGEEGWNQAD